MVSPELVSSRKLLGIATDVFYTCLKLIESIETLCNAKCSGGTGRSVVKRVTAALVPCYPLVLDDWLLFFLATWLLLEKILQDSGLFRTPWWPELELIQMSGGLSLEFHIKWWLESSVSH